MAVQLIVQRSLADPADDLQYLVTLMEIINVVNSAESRAEIAGLTAEEFVARDKAAIEEVENNYRKGSTFEKMRIASEITNLFDNVITAYGVEVRALQPDGTPMTKPEDDLASIEIWGEPRG